MSDIINFDLGTGRRTKKKRKPFVRKWLTRSAWVLLILIVAGRLTLSMWLPPALRGMGHRMGLELSYKKMDLSLLGGQVTLKGLNAHIKGQGEEGADAALANLDYVVLDVSVSKLIRGVLRVNRAEVDGGKVYLERNQGGEWNTQSLLRSSPEEPSGLRSYFEEMQWSNLRFQDLTVYYKDSRQVPAAETQAKVDITLADLGYKDRPVRVELRAQASDWLDGLTADATFFPQENRIETTAQVELYGMRAPLARRLLEPLGLTSTAENHGVRFQIQSQWDRDPETNQLFGPILIRELALQADHRPALIVQTLESSLTKSTAQQWNLGPTRIQGLELHAKRTTDGSLWLASLSQMGSKAKNGSESTLPVEATLSQESNGKETRLAWDFAPSRCMAESLQCEDVHLILEDETTQPKAKIDLSFAGLVTGLDWQSQLGLSPIEIELEAKGSELFESLEIRGNVEVGASGSLALELNGSGVSLEALDPYLRSAACRTDLTAATLSGSVTSTWSTGVAQPEWNMALRDGQFIQGDQDFRIANGALESISWSDAGLNIGALRLQAAEFPLGRDAVGQWFVPGLRSIADPEGVTPWRLPDSIALGEMTLSDLHVNYSDALRGQSPTQQPIHIVDAHLREWQVSSSHPSQSHGGPLRIDAHVPGFAERLTIQGQVDPPEGQANQGRGKWNAKVTLAGLEDTTVVQWWSEQGLEADWLGCDIAFSGVGDWRATEKGWQGSADFMDVAMSRRSDSWLSMQRVAVTDWRRENEAWSAKEILVTAPKFQISRDQRGAWTTLGLRAPSEELAGLGPAHILRSSTKGWPVDRTEIEDLECEISDARQQPMYEGRILLSAQMEHLETASPADRMEFEGLLQVQNGSTNSLERASLKGAWVQGPGTDHLQMDLSVQGLQGAEVAAYLPNSWKLALETGDCEARLSADWSPVSEGGVQLQLDCPELIVRDSINDRTWISLAGLEADFPRIDPANRVFQLATGKLAGFEGEIVRKENGSLEAFGLHMPKPAPAIVNAIEAIDAIDASAKTNEEPAQEVEVVQPEFLKWLDSLSASRFKVGPTQASIQRLLYRDETRLNDSGSAPELTLAANWDNKDAWVWNGPGHAENHALDVKLDGQLLPLAENFQANLQVDPLGAHPQARVAWKASGIQGKTLSDWWPEGASHAHARDLQGARFKGRLQADFTLPENQPKWVTSYTDGFAMELSLHELELQPNVIIDPIFTVDSMEFRAEKVIPAWNQWELSRIQCQSPKVTTWHDHEGLHAFGFTWNQIYLPSLSSQPALAQDAEAMADQIAKTAGLTIDRIQINDLDWDHNDLASTPNVRLPLRNGELEILRFGTGERTLPTRLHLTADAGKVRVPVRHAEQEETSNHQAQNLETRNAFDRLEARGRAVLGTHPEGWFQLDVAGLELFPWAGWFANQGVQLKDGLLDIRNTLRFHGVGGLTVDSRSTVEHLSAQALPGRRPERDLRLTKDLRSTLKDLTDMEGRTQLPLRYDISRQAMSGTSMAQGARNAFTELAAQAHGTALAHSGSIQTTVGRSEPDLRVRFIPGSSQLTPDSREALLQWGRKHVSNTEKALVLQHEFGSQDLARASTLGSPPAASLMELLKNLRMRKANLAREYVEASAQARSHLQYGSPEEAAQSREVLVGLDRKRAHTEQAIDNVLDLLAPGSERRQDRRTRASALDLVKDRQASIHAGLMQAGWQVPERSIGMDAPSLEPTPQSSGGVIELHLQP